MPNVDVLFAPLFLCLMWTFGVSDLAVALIANSAVSDLPLIADGELRRIGFVAVPGAELPPCCRCRLPMPFIADSDLRGIGFGGGADGELRRIVSLYFACIAVSLCPICAVLGLAVALMPNCRRVAEAVAAGADTE